MRVTVWETFHTKFTLLTSISVTSPLFLVTCLNLYSFPFSLISPTLSPYPLFCHHLCYRHSSHSPVVVDVGGCHCIAKVGPHLEHITKTQLACNHTTVHRSLSFLSFSFSVSSLLYPPPLPPEAFLFNLSIPQSPGVSSSPFSWSSVLGLL